MVRFPSDLKKLPSKLSVVLRFFFAIFHWIHWSKTEKNDDKKKLQKVQKPLVQEITNFLKPTPLSQGINCCLSVANNNNKL